MSFGDFVEEADKKHLKLEYLELRGGVGNKVLQSIPISPKKCEVDVYYESDVIKDRYIKKTITSLKNNNGIIEKIGKLDYVDREEYLDFKNNEFNHRIDKVKKTT